MLNSMRPTPLLPPRAARGIPPSDPCRCRTTSAPEPCLRASDMQYLTASFPGHAYSASVGSSSTSNICDRGSTRADQDNIASRPSSSRPWKDSSLCAVSQWEGGWTERRRKVISNRFPFALLCSSAGEERVDRRLEGLDLDPRKRTPPPPATFRSHARSFPIGHARSTAPRCPT